MIRAQPTPNPNAMKFTADRALVESGSLTFNSAQDARGNAVAGPLFEVEGVASVFMVADFVTVIKSPQASWPSLVPELTARLERALG